MTRKTSIFVVIAVCILVTPVTVQAEGDPAKGLVLYESCQDCHGANGEGNHELNAPSLAGQYHWYLLAQMKNFRSGLRGQHPHDTFGTVMAEASQTLTDDQAVEDVVAYIATLEPVQIGRTEQSGDPERGQELYAICVDCHRSKAQGRDGKAPKLAGQYDWYLIRQLESFKDEVRGATLDDKPGFVMRSLIRHLKKGQDMRDVVAYTMSLQ